MSSIGPADRKSIQVLVDIDGREMSLFVVVSNYSDKFRPPLMDAHELLQALN